tara:strand:- start:2198 stop:2797 length:600 start_codon:yes stop_codon:yes gene_type:complete
MYKCFLITILFCYSYFSFGQCHDSEKVEKLKKYYSNSYLVSDSLLYRTLFFNEFPSSFKELNCYYGFGQNRRGVLVEEAKGHIFELFNNLNSINDTVYYNKIIKIAIGGKWNADAIFYFQYGLWSKVLKSPDLTVYLLNKYSDYEISNFFDFFFDGNNHPKWEVLPVQLEEISKQNKKIYSIMEKSFDNKWNTFREATY